MRNSVTGPNSARGRLTVLAVAILIVLPAACGGGGGVAGNTYAGNGGVVKVEFKADGKAFVSTGPATTSCTYAESGKTVTLTCEGDKTAFTVDTDGALIGPADGLLARLTKQPK